ncbi:oligosaccharide flippase family protein [Vibrio harveyi]|nr:oligosaccharide flippase family protein [Vibrio harveyi]
MEVYISFSYPLLLHSIASFGKTSLDRIIIYDKFSASVLGIYYTAFQVSSVISVVLMALNKALMPYYYERLKSKDITIFDAIRLSKLSLLLPVVFSFIATLLPDRLYSLVLGDGFENINIYIPIFTFSFFMAIPYYIFWEGI